MIDLIYSNVRYEITYGDHSCSFGAPMAKTDEELADILEEVVKMLRAAKDGKKVIAECDKCHQFILEDESLTEIDGETLCSNCTTQ